MDPQIRPMSEADIPQVGEVFFHSFNFLSEKYRMLPKLSSLDVAKVWAWQIMRYDSTIKMVAEIGGRIAGVCCLNPRGNLGGVGPLAVHPDFLRGLRLNPVSYMLREAILEGAVELESLRGFQEAYNTASFNLMYGVNFLPVSTLLHLSFKKRIKVEEDYSKSITKAFIEDLDELLAFDEPRSKLKRKEDFIFYINWGTVFVCKKDNRINGYLVSLPGKEFTQLGPLVTQNQEDALTLFHKALTVFGKRTYRTHTMARDLQLNKTLMSWGFRLTTVDLLMVRGIWRPGESVEAFGIFPEGV